MQPGIYKTVQIKDGVDVTMAAGIYFVTGGQMNIGKNASLTGTGVMFYDMPNDYFSSDGFVASSHVTLTAPTSGTYKGISVFEPRDMDKEIHIKSYGNITMTGALYSVLGEFDLRPLSAATVFSFGAYIANLAEWSPNGLGTINLNPTASVPTKRPLLVQ